ncbi:response regulator [Indioceanicola profundi]|uniref:response regulator n=1 Tax=Indioceanicola profundi TaxID=2220096 RepID=UPI000E6AE23A|nr:response regulator [Indioceanicola profundi]
MRDGAGTAASNMFTRHHGAIGAGQRDGAARRLIVVEDEAITALHLETLLAELGYQVCSVEATGEGAIAAAARHNPDLVLMDVRLAGQLDGLAAAHHIRSTYGIPSLLMTAFNDPGTVAKAKASGTIGFIPKPYTARQVEKCVQQALQAVSGPAQTAAEY